MKHAFTLDKRTDLSGAPWQVSVHVTSKRVKKPLVLSILFDEEAKARAAVSAIGEVLWAVCRWKKGKSK
jgi:hypothetical protein